MYDEMCEREDHIETEIIQDCPRCGSRNWHIQESLFVTEYCDQAHLIDFFECFECDASISLDLLARLMTLEDELKKCSEKEGV